MFWTARVTAKGQITLPKGVREYLQLRPGMRVQFILRDGRLQIEPLPDDVMKWYGALRREGGPTDLEEVEQAVRLAIAGEVVRESQGN